MDSVSCVWTRPEGLTQLYGVVSVATIGVFALVRASWTELCHVGKTSAPLLGPPTREAWVDSMRFVLIVFIVMGHYAAVPCSYIAEQTYWLAPLLVWINLFVMPGFAVLSGYLSKAPLTSERVGRLLIFALCPYIFSKLVYWAWFSLEFHVVNYFDPFDAFSNSLGLEWYLIVLVQWRLAIVLMKPFSPLMLLVISLAVGLVSGNWVPSNASLGLQRACSFFPFFVLGYSVDILRLREILTRSSGLTALFRAVFVGALALLFWSPGIARLFMANTLGDLNFDYASAISTQYIAKAGPVGLAPVIMPQPRTTCGSEWAFSFVHRFIRYELGALMLLGLGAWVPSSASLAQYGRHTMYPYLLHPWVFQLLFNPMMQRDLPALFRTLGPFSSGGYVWGYTVLFAPVLTLLLSIAPVRFLTHIVIEPTWLASLLFASDVGRPGVGKTEPPGLLDLPRGALADSKESA